MLKNRSKIILAIFLLAFKINLYAEAGENAVEFLKVYTNARTSALADMGTINSFGFIDMERNPATLINSNVLLQDLYDINKNIKLSHIQWIEDITLNSLEYTQNFYDFSSAMGFYYKQINVPDFEGTDMQGSSTGNFSENSYVLGLAYARDFELFYYYDVTFGLTMKTIETKIEKYKDSALAFDFGGIYRYNEDVNIGVSVLNVGQGIDLGTGEYPLPTTLIVGASVLFDEKFSVLLEAEKERNLSSDFKLGAEYLMNDVLFLRGAYKFQGNKELQTGVSLGFGLMLNNITFDYAYIPFDSDVSSSHKISLSWLFGE